MAAKLPPDHQPPSQVVEGRNGQHKWFAIKPVVHQAIAIASQTLLGIAYGLNGYAMVRRIVTMGKMKITVG